MLQQCTPAPRHVFSPDADSVTSVERTDGPGWRRPMPRVSSMLFDLELEDSEAGEDVVTPGISRQLLKLLQPRNQEERQLGVAVNAAYEKAAAAGRPLSIDELAEALREQGYDVRIRTALGGGGGGECLRNLRHQFLTLNMTGQDGVRVECIIDPSFAEQWGIARPTPSYARVVAALPQVYVGSAVEPLVDFLCSELATAFRAEGATIPPWRAADAMLSKWRPRRSVDCDMLSPPGSHYGAHSPFDTALAHMSRRSLSGRPSKSQRLSGAGGSSGAIHKPAHHSPLHASPRASPKPSPRDGSLLAGSYAGGSFLGGSSFLTSSFLGGRPLAMDKSASKALSDAEAEEAAAAAMEAALAAQAGIGSGVGLNADAFADGYGDGDEASDSSNDSDTATTMELNLRRTSDMTGRSSGRSSSRNHATSGFDGRVSRLASNSNDMSTLSSSWRASDCMPFGGGGGGGGSPTRAGLGGGGGVGRMSGDASRRISMEGISTSDGSDTTQGPPMALQGRLISAPPRLPPSLPPGAAGSAPQASPPQQARRAPSAPQPPLPAIEPDFDFPKPAPAKSALFFARRSAGSTGGRASSQATSGGGGGAGRNSSGGGVGRNSGGRVVKCLPPLEAAGADGRQTSFAFDARRHLQDGHSASAGELGVSGGVPVAAPPPALQGGPGTSPARRAAAVRQHFGIPPPGKRSSPGVRRSLFAAEQAA